MSYYTGLTYRKPSQYKNMSSTQMDSYQQPNSQQNSYPNTYPNSHQNTYPNSHQNSYIESSQGFESRDDYNYDESENEEEIPLDSDYDSDGNSENKSQNDNNQLREEVNLYQNSNNKQQNYHIGNQITNPRGLSPDNNGFYNSYGEYEIKYRDEEREQQNIDLEQNDFGCNILGSSPDNKHQSLFNRVENYCSYLEENMSGAINSLKSLVLND